jgi:hypothetical protein
MTGFDRFQAARVLGTAFRLLARAWLDARDTDDAIRRVQLLHERRSGWPREPSNPDAIPGHEPRQCTAQASGTDAGALGRVCVPGSARPGLIFRHAPDRRPGRYVDASALAIIPS